MVVRIERWGKQVEGFDEAQGAKRKLSSEIHSVTVNSTISSEDIELLGSYPVLEIQELPAGLPPIPGTRAKLWKESLLHVC